MQKSVGCVSQARELCSAPNRTINWFTGSSPQTIHHAGAGQLTAGLPQAIHRRKNARVGNSPQKSSTNTVIYRNTSLPQTIHRRTSKYFAAIVFDSIEKYRKQ
jgi:hypothetical protein